MKKSFCTENQIIEFLGIEIDSIKMTLSLTPGKVQKVVKTCQDFLSRHSIALLDFIRVIIIHYTSSGTYKDPQQQQIMCLREKMNCQSVITLNTESRLNLVDKKHEVLQ